MTRLPENEGCKRVRRKRKLYLKKLYGQGFFSGSKGVAEAAQLREVILLFLF